MTKASHTDQEQGRVSEKRIQHLVKSSPTGRLWGSKRPEERKRFTFAGVSFDAVARDAWEGGDGETVKQEYWRAVWIEHDR